MNRNSNISKEMSVHVPGRHLARNPVPRWRSVFMTLMVALSIGSVSQTHPAQAAPLDQKIIAAFSFEIERFPDGPICPGEIIKIIVSPKLNVRRSNENTLRNLGNVLLAPVTAEVTTPSGQNKPIPAFDDVVDSLFKTTFLIQFSEVGTHYLTVQLTMRDIRTVEGMGDMTIEEATTTDIMDKLRRVEMRRALTSREEIKIEVIPCKIRVSGFHTGRWIAPFTGYGYGDIASVDLIPDNKAVYTGSSEFTYNGKFLYSISGCYSSMIHSGVKAPVTFKAEIRMSYIFIRISFGAGVGRVEGEAACGGASGRIDEMWINAIGAGLADGTMAVPLKPGFQLKADFPVGAYVPQLTLFAEIIRE